MGSRMVIQSGRPYSKESIEKHPQRFKTLKTTLPRCAQNSKSRKTENGENTRFKTPKSAMPIFYSPCNTPMPALLVLFSFLRVRVKVNVADWDWLCLLTCLLSQCMCSPLSSFNHLMFPRLRFCWPSRKEKYWQWANDEYLEWSYLVKPGSL